MALYTYYSQCRFFIICDDDDIDVDVPLRNNFTETVALVRFFVVVLCLHFLCIFPTILRLNYSICCVVCMHCILFCLFFCYLLVINCLVHCIK